MDLCFGFRHLNMRVEAGVTHRTDAGTNNNASLTDQGCPVLHKRTGHDAAVKVYLTHMRSQCLPSTNFLLTLQMFVSLAYPRSRTHTHVIGLSCLNQYILDLSSQRRLFFKFQAPRPSTTLADHSSVERPSGIPYTTADFSVGDLAR